DGMAAVAIVEKLFDPAADPDPAGRGPKAVPQHTSFPPQAARSAGLRRWGRGLHRIRAVLSGGEVGDTILLGRRGDTRGVVFVEADLAALERSNHRRGVTVNDALLAAVACGYHAALSAAGERIPPALPVSVPVALSRRGTSGNHVGLMLVRLPIGVADPDERLRQISAQTRVERVTARDQGTLELMRGPLGARLMDRLARRQHLVAGFVTNVRGPANAPRLAGALIERMLPVAVIAGNVRLGVAALSAGGRLACSVHFDADAVPGAEFGRAMSEELNRLST
ncbi:MAG: WS/DGAT domain-containing protein, partial [Microbacterium sp.]